MSAALSIAVAAEVALSRIRAAKARPAWETRAENRLHRQIAGMFDDITDGIIRDLLKQGGVPGDAMAQTLLAQRLTDALDDLAETVTSGSGEAAQHGRNAAVDNLRKRGLSVSFSDVPQGILDRLRGRAFEASRATLERMTGNVIENLAASVADGLGIDDAAGRLRESFTGMRDFELRRIARTSIQTAQSEAAHLTLEELGISFHQWISADDDRTRESHIDLHEVIVAVGEPFPNGLLHPGDTGGDVEEWINCRCRAVPFIMPEGMLPPAGAAWFYESDLEDFE